MAGLDKNITDLNSLYETIKQSTVAEQERAKLEAARLEEEKLRRLAEEGRVKALKVLTDKIDIVLEHIMQIKPIVEIVARNGDSIVEILRILASNIPHMSEKDVETISAHIAAVMASQQSRFGVPVNVHVGTKFDAKEDLTINTTGDQRIG